MLQFINILKLSHLFRGPLLFLKFEETWRKMRNVAWNWL